MPAKAFAIETIQQRRLADLQHSGAGALILLTAVVITRIPALFIPFFEDEVIYSAMASRILAGFSPYLGAVDHKPPGIALLYAAIYWLVGRNRLFAVRIVLLISVWLTALVIRRIAAQLESSPRTAFLCALCYILASAAGSPFDTQAANTELFAAPVIATAVWCVLIGGRPRLFMAGASIAIATLLRYPSALVGPALALVVLTDWRSDKKSLPRLLAAELSLAAGFAFIAAVFLAIMSHLHAVEALLFWGWKYNCTYLTTLTKGEMAKNALLNTLRVGVRWIPLLLLFRRPANGRSRVVIGAWLFATVCGLIPGGRFFEHYYLTLLPPLCLALDFSRITRPILTLAAVSSTIAFVVQLVPYSIPSRVRHDNAVERDVARAVMRRTKPEERVFVWGASPGIYHYADRVMATRFSFCNYHTGRIWGSRYVDVNADGSAYIEPRAWTELMEDLEAAPPVLIIDAAAGHLNRFDRDTIGRQPQLARFVAAHYTLVETVDGVPIYGRKSAS